MRWLGEWSAVPEGGWSRGLWIGKILPMNLTALKKLVGSFMTTEAGLGHVVYF
jgi:hypothetical protein